MCVYGVLRTQPSSHAMAPPLPVTWWPRCSASEMQPKAVSSPRPAGPLSAGVRITFPGHFLSRNLTLVWPCSRQPQETGDILMKEGEVDDCVACYTEELGRSAYSVADSVGKQTLNQYLRPRKKRQKWYVYMYSTYIHGKTNVRKSLIFTLVIRIAMYIPSRSCTDEICGGHITLSAVYVLYLG